jgi:stage II sporulation protein D
MLTLAFASPAWGASVFYIRGGGNGHGVGMSQYGAYGYALHGASYPAILAHYYEGTTLQSTNPNQLVRVLLRSGPAAFSGATKAASKALNPSVTYSVQALANGEIALYNHAGKKIGTFAAPLAVTGPAPLMVAGLGSYRGTLEFRPDGSGAGVETIDAVGLDDYVRGVVAAEMPASWAAQALDAQAVAARTYALTSDVGGRAYQLYSDTRSQAYGGVSAETASSDAAVAATRGQIVTYGGAPAITYFFSSSGGYTEDVENAFPGALPEPWLRGVPDPYDGAGGDPYHRWTYSSSVATAATKLAGLLDGSLIGIQVITHGVSPRILTAAVVGTKGRTTTTGIDLQRRFGLMSTWARFTTITTNAGTVGKAIRRATVGQSPDLSLITAETATRVSALVRQLFAPGAPIVYGSVFPGPKGATVLVQQLTAGHWRTVRTARLRARGGFSVTVPGPGSYRVVFSGLAGPTVSAV